MRGLSNSSSSLPLIMFGQGAKTIDNKKTVVLTVEGTCTIYEFQIMLKQGSNLLRYDALPVC